MLLAQGASVDRSNSEVASVRGGFAVAAIMAILLRVAVTVPGNRPATTKQAGQQGGPDVGFIFVALGVGAVILLVIVVSMAQPGKRSSGAMLTPWGLESDDGITEEVDRMMKNLKMPK